jgi:hypothetical protein
MRRQLPWLWLVLSLETAPFRRKSDPRDLIRWLLKSAIIFELGIPSGEMYKVHESFRSVARGVVPVSDLHVFGACVPEPQFNVHLRPGYPVWNRGELSYLAHERSFNFVIQLNHLWLRLVSCPDATPSIRKQWDGIYRVMPALMSQRNVFNFPHHHWFDTYQGFEAFLEVVPK